MELVALYLKICVCSMETFSTALTLEARPYIKMPDHINETSTRVAI